MARPKKDQEVCAEERILAAFWELLEDMPLRAITVRTIVEKAGVNRGTFYYHFADLDALTHRAIERELFEKHSIMHELLLLVSGAIDQIPPEDINQHMDKTALLIRQGGSKRVVDEVLSMAERVWKAALCPNGEALNEQALMLVKYNINGTIGLFSSLSGEGGSPSQEALDFQKWSATRTLEGMCELQGVDKDVVIDRISAAMSLSEGEK